VAERCGGGFFAGTVKAQVTVLLESAFSTRLQVSTAAVKKSVLLQMLKIPVCGSVTVTL
jgi:hypothetical protein